MDAWQEAFRGMENKIFMGGSCDYGFQKGFGVRRGFVEMYLYNIPNRDLGQYIDENGYLSVDENAPDVRWMGVKDSLVIKVAYFDNHAGELNLVYSNDQEMVKKKQQFRAKL